MQEASEVNEFREKEVLSVLFVRMSSSWSSVLRYVIGRRRSHADLGAHCLALLADI